MQSRRLIGVVAFAFVGAGVFYVAKSMRVRHTGCGLPSRPVQMGAASRLFAEAKAAVDRKDWVEAHAKLSQLEREHPGYAGTRYLDGAIREGQIAERLERARTALDEARWVDARRDLLAVPADTRHRETREFLKLSLANATARLSAEAEDLRRYPEDREKMVRLEELGAVLEDLEPGYGTTIRSEARLALEELDVPWAKALERYDEGDVADALARAKACAKKNEDCARLARTFAVVQAQLPKLSKLSTAKLLALHETSQELSEGVPTLQIEQELRARYEAVARRCRTAGDWICVDRQLALADAIQVDFEDTTIRDELSEWVEAELGRAANELPTRSDRGKAILVRLSSLKSVDLAVAADLLEQWKQRRP